MSWTYVKIRFLYKIKEDHFLINLYESSDEGNGKKKMKKRLNNFL